MNRLLILIIFFTNCAFGQLLNLPNPVTMGNEAHSETFTSDYGPRIVLNSNGVISGSRFHPGLDYGLGTEGKAYAVEAGAFGYNYLGSENAHITIGNYIYKHVFEGRTTLDYCWELVSNGISTVLIIRSGSGLDESKYTLVKVYATENYPDNFYYDELTGQTVFTSNQFVHSANQGDWIFVARDYGVTGPQNDHLHFQRSDESANNPLNPLSYLARQDGTTGTIAVELRRNTNNQAVEFSSNIIYGEEIILQALADNNSVTCNKDLNSVYYYLSNSNSDFGEIAFWDFTHPTQHMGFTDRYNGKSNTPRYNIRQADAGCTPQTDTRQGVFPIPGLVSKEYYKTYWYTDEIDNSSGNVFKLKYEDGQYHFRGEATDLTGHSVVNEKLFYLDNYRPFVKKVTVFNDKQEMVYIGELVYNTSSNKLMLQKSFGVNLKNGDDVKLVVEPSEPMQGIQVIFNNEQCKSQTQSNQKETNAWEFDFFNQQFSSNEVQIKILNVSKDLAGNKLEGMTSTSNISIPKRTIDGLWFPEPKELNDEIHKIPVVAGLQSNFDYQFGNVSLQVNFHDNSTGTPDKWQWNFGDGTTSTIQHPTHTYGQPGSYIVSLLVHKNGIPSGTTKTATINIDKKPNANFNNIVISTYGEKYVEFRDMSTGNPTKWNWTFEGGNPSSSTEKNPKVHYYNRGSFDVTLEAINDFGSNSLKRENYIIYDYDQVEISGGVTCSDCDYEGGIIIQMKGEDGIWVNKTTTYMNGYFSFKIDYGTYVDGIRALSNGVSYTNSDSYPIQSYIYSSISGIELYIKVLDLQIIIHKGAGLHYFFEAKGYPTDVFFEFEWTFNDGFAYTSHSGNLDRWFECSEIVETNYSVNLRLIPNSIFDEDGSNYNLTAQKDFVIPRCVKVTPELSLACKNIPLNGYVSLINESYPETDISKYIMYWSSYYSPMFPHKEVWITEKGSNDDRMDRNSKLYQGTCGIFYQKAVKVGRQNVMIYAYNLADQPSPKYTVYFNVIDVNAEVNSSHSDFINKYLYEEETLKSYYAGTITIDSKIETVDKNIEIGSYRQTNLTNGCVIKSIKGHEIRIKEIDCIYSYNKSTILEAINEDFDKIDFIEFEDLDAKKGNNSVTFKMKEKEEYFEQSSIVNAYPNPNGGKFVIETPSNNGIIEIFDLMGVKIYTKSIVQNKTDIDLSDLSQGIYIVSFKYEKNVELVKIIKE